MEKQKVKKVVELDPVSQRLMEFVTSEDGPSPVAARMGKHPQLFYNIREGKSKPSMDTLREIKMVFPHFDLDWVIMGTRSENPPATPGPEADKSVQNQVVPDTAKVIKLEADVKRLTEAVNYKDEMIDQLKETMGRLWEILPTSIAQRMHEMGKLVASSRTTAEGLMQEVERFVVEGFRPDAFLPVQATKGRAINFRPERIDQPKSA